MPIYRIADLNISISPIVKGTENRLKPYLSNSDTYDFEVSVSQGDIAKYKSECNTPCTDEAAESVLILTEICNRVLQDFNGIFFHSSSLMLDGEAYVFTAVSGTGKSTHTALWRKHFGERVTMINDDKPIIRMVDGQFFIYGTPWMGKSDIGNNVKAPIKAIYIIRRSNENYAKKVSAGQYFKDILEATVVPTDKETMHKLLSLFDMLFREVPLFLLNCNMDDEAVTTAYNAVITNNK